MTRAGLSPVLTLTPDPDADPEFDPAVAAHSVAQLDVWDFPHADTVDAPDGVAEGSQLVAVVQVTSDGDETLHDATLTDWSLEGTVSSGEGGRNVRAWVLTRVASDDEPAEYEFRLTGRSRVAVATVVRVVDVDTSELVVAGDAAVAGSSAVAPSGRMPADGLVLYAGAARGNHQAIATPEGMESLHGFYAHHPYAVNSSLGTRLAHEQVGAGATGDRAGAIAKIGRDGAALLIGLSEGRRTVPFEPGPPPGEPDLYPDLDVADGNPDPVDPADAVAAVSRSTRIADCDGNLSRVEPGDVVALEPGDRGALRITNCHGQPDAPITFVNDGDIVNIEDSTFVYAGVDIRESSHIRVTGSGAPDGEGRTVGAPYAEDEQDAGIRVSGTQRGVAFKYAAFFRSTDPHGGVVTQGLQVDHIQAGPTSKNGFHGPEKDRLDERWTVVGFRLHHNYVVDNHLPPDRDGEGFYLGATQYERHDSAYTGDVEVDHNLVVRSGRDGIQLGSAWYGDNRIHHNVAREVGQGQNQDSFGVILNRGTTADVYNNSVFDSGRDAIRDQGIQGSRVFNNVIARGGAFTSSSSRGIRVSSSRDVAPREHLADNEGGVKVWNNTIVDMPDEAIYIGNDEGSDVNEVRNNVMRGNGGAIRYSDASADETRNLKSYPQYVDTGHDNARVELASP